MGPDLLISLLAGILSLFAGLITATNAFQRYAERYKYFRKFFNKHLGRKPEASYSERLATLTTSLMTASEEVDSVLQELSRVAQERERTVKKMEADLQSLQTREKELQGRIEHLQNVPLPVAEYFAQLTSTGEKRSARRDYVLFGAGVVVSTVIAIILKLVGLG